MTNVYATAPPSARRAWRGFQLYCTAVSLLPSPPLSPFSICLSRFHSSSSPASVAPLSRPFVHVRAPSP
eukprot:6156024-Prymnesium_polylepis.1